VWFTGTFTDLASGTCAVLCRGDRWHGSGMGILYHGVELRSTEFEGLDIEPVDLTRFDDNSDEFEDFHVTGDVDNGLIRFTMDSTGRVQSLTIDSSAMQVRNPDSMADLIQEALANTYAELDRRLAPRLALEPQGDIPEALTQPVADEPGDDMVMRPPTAHEVGFRLASVIQAEQELAAMTFVGSDRDGHVHVDLQLSKGATGITVAPELVDVMPTEKLTGLILEAFQDAHEKSYRESYRRLSEAGLDMADLGNR
jgi:DNA-binding protein YbaB